MNVHARVLLWIAGIAGGLTGAEATVAASPNDPVAPDHAGSSGERISVAIRIAGGIGALEELTWAAPGVELAAELPIARGFVAVQLGYAPVDNHTFLSDGRIVRLSAVGGVRAGALRVGGAIALEHVAFYADPDVLPAHPGVDLVTRRTGLVPTFGLEASVALTAHTALGVFARAAARELALYREGDADPGPPAPRAADGCCSPACSSSCGCAEVARPRAFRFARAGAPGGLTTAHIPRILVDSRAGRSMTPSNRISTRIEAVTAYRAGARVRRVGELSAGEAGFPAQVCVAGLPLALDDSSVRVSVEPAFPRPAGSAGDAQPPALPPDVLPSAVDLRVVLDVPDRDAELAPAVSEELAAARLAMRRVIAQMEQINRELDRVAKLGFADRPSGADGQPPKPSPLEARMSLLALRTARERALRDELAALQAEARDREREQKRLEDHHRRASTARQAQEHELRKALVITLAGGDPARAGRVRLVAHYLVPGARWAPSYTVQLASDDDRARLSMRAVVAQQTGEDWSGVALSLSTADPQSFTELPELASLRIGRRQRTPPRPGWREPPTGAEALYRDYDLAFRKRFQSEQLPLPADALDEPTIPVPTAPPRAPTMLGHDDIGEAIEEQLEVTRDLDHDTDEVAVVPPAPNMSPHPHVQPRARRGLIGGLVSRMTRSEDSDFDDDSAPTLGAPPPAPMAPGPPPAPGMAMPQAMPAMAAPARKRSAPARPRGSAPSPEGGFGGAQPQVDYAASYGDFPDEAPTGALAHGRPPAPEPLDAGVAAPDDLLVYGDLRMPSARAHARGKLVLASRTAVYMELLAAAEIELSFDPIAAVARAQRRAYSPLERALPDGYLAADSDAETYDYAYEAQTPVDVPSDGAFHSLPLIASDAAVGMRHVVVPRESTDVFRLAEVQNPLDAPLLAGPVDIYLDGVFLLTSRGGFTAPGGVLRLGLGVEQAVKVSRNTAFREETAGLMRGSLLLKHTIRIGLESHLSRAIECEVRERIPSLREDEDDIEIAVTAVEPAWEPYEPNAGEPEVGLRGGHRWRIRLERGEKRELRCAYDIRISGKHELVGGNRREA